MSAPTTTAVYPNESRERDHWIVSRRPGRAVVDVRRPHAYVIEHERSADGEIVDIATLFLTGRECPWRCLMCDLWKNTTEERTPVGAIPAQIDFALAELGGSRREEAHELAGEVIGSSGHAGSRRQIKLYNSGSFFDRAAVPFEDYEAIARRVAGFERVIVESHPALIGEATLRFRDLLNEDAVRGASEGRQGLDCGGAPPLCERARSCGGPTKRQSAGAVQDAGATPGNPLLEVALGLETAHPDVLAKLNKRFTLDDFARAAEFLRREGIALRVFVLVRPPFMTEAEGLEWAVRSAEFAFDCGATVVSLIPTRFGNGALEALATVGQFAPPHLASLEAALEQGIALGRGRVFADLWDLEKFSNCPACYPARRERLNQMNLRQCSGPGIECECDHAR